MTWRQILMESLTFRIRAKFHKHFEDQKEDLPYYDGGDRNTIFLKFDNEHEADKVTSALKGEFDKIHGYKATKTQEGHIKVSYSTKLDKINKKNRKL